MNRTPLKSPSPIALAIALIAGLLTSFLSVPQSLEAQESPSQRSHEDDEAFALFEAGRNAFEQGRFAEAYARFVRAHALSHRTGLLYNIATAADRGDQTAEAIAAYEQYLAEDPNVENRAFIESRLAVLHARPVAATETPTATTTSLPLPEVAEPEREVVRSEADPAPAIALFTLAGVSGAAAIITGVMGWTARSELELACPMRACTDTTLQGRASEMGALGMATDVLAGASLALAVTGLVVFLVAPSSTNDGALSLALSPSGLSLRGAF